MSDRRILFVGLSCLDFINVLSHYPEEDTEIRPLQQFFNRGGNAANSAVVASQLGGCVEYFGTLASDSLSQIIKKDLKDHNVRYENCITHEGAGSATSCVIINAGNGSRTILHANSSLPELAVPEFSKLNLANYKWIHFEGRNITNILEMIKIVEDYNSRNSNTIKISIELEKPDKADVDKLLTLGHLVFISKDYAMARGYTSSESALCGLHKQLRSGALFICAWGSQGAWGRDTDGTIYHAPAFSPEKVIDTLGAGDTFNAGVVWALNQGKELSNALNLGCEVAGRKCAMYGFSGVAEKLNIK